ncbi:Bro-N domain-containing protein [Geobacter sulfurreducens]|nr:Bro-N domain-containing protein [Geobacter sulfurreducens]
MIDNEPWFVAADVCKVLEIQNVSKAVSALDPDEKGLTTSYTPGGPQKVTVINEPGLYSLIMTSRKPSAKQFKRWGGLRFSRQREKPQRWTTPRLTKM